MYSICLYCIHVNFAIKLFKVILYLFTQESSMIPETTRFLKLDRFFMFLADFACTLLFFVSESFYFYAPQIILQPESIIFIVVFAYDFSLLIYG